MENALNKLRAKAKIEYLGDFTELNNKSTSEAAIVKQDEKKPTNMDNSLINRGINGL